MSELGVVHQLEHNICWSVAGACICNSFCVFVIGCCCHSGKECMMQSELNPNFRKIKWWWQWKIHSLLYRQKAPEMLILLRWKYL